MLSPSVTTKLNSNRVADLIDADTLPPIRHVDGVAEVDWSDDHIKMDPANFPMRLAVKHQSNPALLVECWVHLVKDEAGNPVRLRANAVLLKLRNECDHQSLGTVDAYTTREQYEWSERQALSAFLMTY